MKQKSEIAILYLSENFRKKITLKELAKVVGVSPFHFHRQFVAENNCTPQAYLENIRLLHATHIMAAFPNWSITDVAFECGYTSPGIFSRAFKKYHGIAPSNYQSQEVIIPEGYEKKVPLNIQYHSKKTVAVQKVPLISKQLNLSYHQLVDANPSSKTIFGFFLDAPFHMPLEECRFFMGIAAPIADKNAPQLTFPAGYYTSMIIKGGFDNLKEKVISLNQRIQKKGYVIDTLIGYEKIIISENAIPFDYLNSTREIFMKIKRE